MLNKVVAAPLSRKRIHPVRRSDPPTAASTIRDARPALEPDAFERYRLLGVLSAAELREWQMVRAAMLADYHARVAARAMIVGDVTPASHSATSRAA